VVSTGVYQHTTHFYSVCAAYVHALIPLVDGTPGHFLLWHKGWTLAGWVPPIHTPWYSLPTTTPVLTTASTSVPRKLTDIEIVELTPQSGAFWPGTTEASCYSLFARALLGKGAFASVYGAVHISTENTVAIKVFSAGFREDRARAVSVANPSSRWETEGAPIDYLREARLLSQLRHPRIVELQQLFKAQPPSKLAGERGAWCMVLGFCNGGSVGDFISTVLRHKPPQGEQVCDIYIYALVFCTTVNSGI
jgi:hypothetical protein